ncbi:MAG: tripartite tricarboxylate transporter TctB family protein [Desulfobacterales bacterium]
MNRTYVIAYGAWILFAGAVGMESWRLGFGGFVRPGPGFVPFLAAAALGALSVIALLQTLLAGANRSDGKGFRGGDILKIFVAVLFLFVGVLLWDVIGFIPATFLLLLFLFRCVEPLGWRRVVIASALTLAFTHILFVVLLGVRLPQGRVWTYFMN